MSSDRKILELYKFPRFSKEYQDDKRESWGESLRNNGYPSAREISTLVFEIDGVEYTHFILKWS